MIINRMYHMNQLCKRYFSVYYGENILSEDNMKKTAIKFAKMPPIRLQMHQPPKKAAVLIPLCVIDGKVSLLYTLRAPHLKSHRGQVSFPGGMLDMKDKDLQYTALRETKEELGLDAENIKLWGSGQMIVTRGETCVLPVIGQITSNLDINSLEINHNEVKEVFTASLEDLCDPKKTGYTQFKDGFSIPVFLGARRKIWGLTAVITNMFLKSLLPSAAYKHRIKYVNLIGDTLSG